MFIVADLVSLKGGCTGSTESILVKMPLLEITCRSSIVKFIHIYKAVIASLSETNWDNCHWHGTQSQMLVHVLENVLIF